MRTFEVHLNRRKHSFERFKHLLIFKPKDVNTFLLQKPHAFYVVLGPRRIKVTLSIQLHSQSAGRTVEVHNIRPHTMLTPEFPAADLGTL